MATKLGRKKLPTGHSRDDFKCFGPPATKDGEYVGTKIADMGCFMQRDDDLAESAGKAKDSNKYYHAAVVQSKNDNTWYVYVEWGREGAPSPDFQFIECGSESEADTEYAKACKGKNISRGKWEKHPKLGDRLVPKSASKDLYLIRALATRSTGLPDAKTITCDEGAKKPKAAANKKTKKKAVDCEPQTLKLMSDLSVATVKYTRSSMVNDTIPTQRSIDTARDILDAAIERAAIVGDNTDAQTKDAELMQLTRDMYSMIPKKKGRNVAPIDWILNQTNIAMWQQDLDAFESALYSSVDLGEIENDPFGGMKITMTYLPKTNPVGEWIHAWMPSATRNAHGWISGRMHVKNAWIVDRHGDAPMFAKAQQEIADSKAGRITERPLHQPDRGDLQGTEKTRAEKSNTALLFHGTRSVNVSGILRESLRMPRQLKGVHITGAMFGPGIYWADDYKKSAGYCSLRGSIWSGGSGGVRNRGAFMFVGEVALGKPYVAPGPRNYMSPPDRCHSVFGKGSFNRGASSGVQNNEWIVYKPQQNRLRYLVEFEHD